MDIISKIIGKFIGNKSDRDIKKIQPIVIQINKEYELLKTVSNDNLRKKTTDLKVDIHNFIKTEADEISALKLQATDDNTPIEERELIYEKIDRIEKEIDLKIELKLREILPVAFAIMKETARRFKENKELKVKANDLDRELSVQRNDIVIDGDYAIYHNTWMAGGNTTTWEMLHYDVQLIGGIVLHEGKISEMATGEGKTLVATLPVFLNALSGRGVHVVTVNNYLAKRDAEWMGTLYEFHGLRVDCIDNHQPNSDARRKAYLADITFGTNNEFGFDYLRDNMAIRPEDIVQRKHNYAIIDEVDSVLIDDARTPLIISGPIEGGKGDKQLFDEYKPRVVKLFNEQKKLVTNYLAQAKVLLKSENKTDKEQGAILLVRAYKGLPKNTALIKFLSEKGNKTVLHETENIYIADNYKRMPEITDELFFVIDEKHNSVEMTDKGNNLITSDLNDDKFFVLPDIGAEVSEIERSNDTDADKQERKDKVIAEYAIKSERVHTVNQLLKAYAMFEIDVEYVVIENKVKIVDEQTGRIMEGRRYSDGLHQAIEAKENVKVEAATQTFATITLQNYFRMYKKLAGMTGTAETESGEFWDIYKLDVVVIPTNKPIKRDDREDLVYKTKREKYNAVILEINELVKKGRPVLVGTTSVEISELLSRTLKMRNIEHNVLNAKLHQKEADIVANAGKKAAVTIATNMAGRGTDIKLSEEVRQAGGLAIIATERHDSRRVDRQLRGRAGRQGDPGSSQFFVSLEDDLMRMFGSDRISKLMDRMGLKEGEVIQHSMITKSIERAQKKVEENNFGIRKRLLEYDDVMNSQREVVYKQRRHALHGERIDVDIINMMYDTCTSIVEAHHGNDFQDFRNETIRVLATDSPVNEPDFFKKTAEEISELLFARVSENYSRKKENIKKQSFPVFKNIYDNQGANVNNIIVPMTDGKFSYHIITNLNAAVQTQGKELINSFEKQIILHTIDQTWKEHLREMDELKQSVQNASYEQKDPLLIYKFESYGLFRSMIDKNNKTLINTLMNINIAISEPSEIKQSRQEKRLDMSKYKTGKDEFSDNASSSEENKQDRTKIQPVRAEKKFGRNEIVKVRYTNGEVAEGKYKKFENDIESGNAVMIN